MGLFSSARFSIMEISTHLRKRQNSATCYIISKIDIQKITPEVMQYKKQEKSHPLPEIRGLSFFANSLFCLIYQNAKTFRVLVTFRLLVGII